MRAHRHEVIQDTLTHKAHRHVRHVGMWITKVCNVTH